MRLGMQAKPDASDGPDALGRALLDGSLGQAYTLRATASLSGSTTIHLGIAPFGGSVVALAVATSQAQSSGSVLVEVDVGGVTTLSATVSSGSSASATATKGVHAVAAGDTIEIVVTDSSFSPTPTDVYVQAILTNEDVGFPRRIPDFAAAYLSGTGPISAVAIDSPLILDADGGHHGTSVSFNLSTGAFTLEGSGQYLVMLCCPSNSDSLVEVWDLTAAALVSGTRAKTQDMGLETRDYRGAGPASMVTILEPSTTRSYEFRVINDGIADPDRDTSNRAAAPFGYSGSNEGVHALIIRIA